MAFDRENIQELVSATEDHSISTNRGYYIESYGCQMNFSDSEIVASILEEEGFRRVETYRNADLILLNTCSIRDNAEQKVKNRLQEINFIKKKQPGTLIGIIGCMAEREKQQLLEDHLLVDMVIGPDAYRKLPQLIAQADSGQKAVNVVLSLEETYADISPVRLGDNGVTAFLSIMRGCNNMCSYCVVPFTRGRERSRDPKSIANEAATLVKKGYKEVTLLGQNVNSYLWEPKDKKEGSMNFPQLLEMVAQISPELRVRFSTSHPKDISIDVLHTMAKYENICNYIHLPIQSGSDPVLQGMKRTYTSQQYLEIIDNISSIVPDCAVSTDIITGFCDETEEDHLKTLDIMEKIRFSMAYMFMYSERPGTPAARNLKDNVPLEEKQKRLNEVIDLQRIHALKSNEADIGKVHKVLVEGLSKRSDDDLSGRNDQNKVVVFPKGEHSVGDYVNVLVTDCTPATLIGKVTDK